MNDAGARPAGYDMSQGGRASVRQQQTVSDDYQIAIPPSFIALFVPAGRTRPVASREEIATRYGFCEDLAQLLTETAASLQFQLGVTEADVLVRVGSGLRGEAAAVSAPESTWVLRRLAELLGWPDPGPDA